MLPSERSAIPPRDFDVCVQRILATGLAVRGAFHVRSGDVVPDTRDGAPRTLILVGNAGSSFWPAFRRSAEYGDGGADPLDRWSKRVVDGLAEELVAHSLFPFGGPPFHPFLRWARRAEPVTPSPLGLLIHPRYGLWHAYRGALLFNRTLAGLPSDPEASSPCLTCADQPCLTGCPVEAFTVHDFDVAACAAHLAGPNNCMDQGCQARNACPIGKPFAYVADEHRFHLNAFLNARQS